MSTVAADDRFTASAGKRLAWYALLAIGGVAALMYLLGWASGLTGEAAAGPGVDVAQNKVRLLLTDEPPQLDSTRSTDMLSGMVLGHVMEGLLRYDASNQLVPGVAHTWDIRNDGATFQLRTDARWSDGQPVTADDFIFAWRTALAPKTASEYAFILYPIKNGEQVNQGKLPLDALGVTAPDAHTLHVEFERPIAYFDKLVAFSTYYPIREDFYASTEGRYGADAVELLYNGPFVITRWVHGAELKLKKNENYWDRDRIRLDAIEWPYVTADRNASLNLFKDGKIAYTALDAENLDEALRKRWHINRFQDGSVFFIEFNHRPERLTRNVHLRKALQLVSDNAELVYKVTKIPGYLPGESIFPVWLKGVDGYLRQEYPAPGLTPDIAEAKRELAIAKRELGLDTWPPLVLLSGDNPLANKQAEYVQGVVRATLGLDIKIDKQIFKQRIAKMLAGEFDMVMAGWGPDFDDPLTFGDLFASWNLNNRGRYNNPELDRQVRIAQSSLDPVVRAEAFAAIQDIIHHDAVIIPQYERGVVYVADPRLKGLVRRAVGPDPDLTNAYIEPDA